MNRDELRRALEGILENLNRARSGLEDAVASAHALRDDVDEESPFDEDYLDEELCVTIENLCDDVGLAVEDVEWMLDDLDEGGGGRD